MKKLLLFTLLALGAGQAMAANLAPATPKQQFLAYCMSNYNLSYNHCLLEWNGGQTLKSSPVNGFNIPQGPRTISGAPVRSPLHNGNLILNHCTTSSDGETICEG